MRRIGARLGYDLVRSAISSRALNPLSGIGHERLARPVANRAVANNLTRIDGATDLKRHVAP